MEILEFKNPFNKLKCFYAKEPIMKYQNCFHEPHSIISARSVVLRILAICILFVPACSAQKTSKTAAWDKGSIKQLLNKTHAKYKNVKDGKNADYIPILTTVPSELFGIVIATRDGNIYSAGDVDYAFSIQSLSKPFTASLVMQEFGGPEAVSNKIGVEPTGLPFNSKLALELLETRSVNPMVNAGAIAAISIIRADSEQKRWEMVLGNLSDFAGEPLSLIQEVYDSEYETCWSNRGIANLLYNYERLYCEPEEALRVYTKACSVGITTKQLAMMGATLANGGINPKTGTKLLDAEHVPELLAIMLMAGFYDESGQWAYTAGLPAKTGVGGGVVAVVPGQFAIAAFSPRLNQSGNSVRSLKAIRHIAGELGVGIFGANPDSAN
jgi:glutaminase